MAKRIVFSLCATLACGGGIGSEPTDAGASSTESAAPAPDAAAPKASAFTRVFSDDFEDGTIAKWALDDTRHPMTVVTKGDDGSLPHSGTSMARGNWNGVALWSDPDAFLTMKIAAKSAPYATDLFIRMWWKLDTAFGTGNVAGSAQGQSTGRGVGCKFLRMNLNVGKSASWFIPAILEPHATFTEEWQDADTGGVFIDHWGTFSLDDDAWHKFEFYVHVDMTNGVVKRWVDGKLLYAFNGKTASSNPGYGYFPMYLASNWSDNPGWAHTANNPWYIDGVEVFSDSPTGAPATGDLSDATIEVP